MVPGNKNENEGDPKEFKLKKRNRDSSFLYISVISVNLLIFACGSGFAWTSPVIPLLKKSDRAVNPLGKSISPLEESWIASLYCLGAAIGPLFAGKLADIFGRKRTLIIFAIPKTACLWILSFATDIKVYYATRLLLGIIAGGAITVVPMYLAEISEKHNKGKIGSFMVVFLTSGVLFSFLVGPYFSVKTFTLCCAIPVVLFFVIFGKFMPESPVFLASQGKSEQTIEALKKLRNKDFDQVQEEVRKISEATIECKEKDCMKVFKDRGLRKGLVISLGLLISQQLSGVNAIVAFLDPIFEASGTGISTYVSTNLIGVIQVLSCILTAAIVEKLGRKPLLLTSSIGSCISTALLGLYFYLQSYQVSVMNQFFWLPIVSLISFIIFFSLGLSGLPWTVTSEIFPSNIIALAFSLGSFSCFISSFMVTMGFPVLIEIYDMARCFWFFSVCLASSTCFIYYLVPETKDLTSFQLQEILRK